MSITEQMRGERFFTQTLGLPATRQISPTRPDEFGKYLPSADGKDNQTPGGSSPTDAKAELDSGIAYGWATGLHTFPTGPTGVGAGVDDNGNQTPGGSSPTGVERKLDSVIVGGWGTGLQKFPTWPTGVGAGTDDNGNQTPGSAGAQGISPRSPNISTGPESGLSPLIASSIPPGLVSSIPESGSFLGLASVAYATSSIPERLDTEAISKLV
jgi:hypothetical protein